MLSKSKPQQLANPMTISGIDAEREPTAQEGIPATYFAGRQTVPAQWLSPIYNEFHREVPAKRSGKK